MFVSLIKGGDIMVGFMFVSLTRGGVTMVLPCSGFDVFVLDQRRWHHGSVNRVDVCVLDQGRWHNGSLMQWVWCLCPWPGALTSWFCHAVGQMCLSLTRGGDIQQHGSALRTQRRACRLCPPGVQTHLSGRGTRRHSQGCRGAVWSHQRGLHLRLRGHRQRRHRQRQQGHRRQRWGERESH